MADSHEPDHLSLEEDRLQTMEDSESSPFNTLWTEFARNHPRLSPPHSPAIAISQRQPSAKVQESVLGNHIDLRTLEYMHGYDTNLQCPICLIPYIDPVELACGHTFCNSCWDQYKTGGSTYGGDRLICPSCRTFELGGTRKASRLIKNMCDDVKVSCPNEGCEVVTARGCVELHALKECPNTLLSCPDPECDQKTRRKNYVSEQCIHNMRAECECGASITLGRGEWISHKDTECPLTGSNCEICHRRLNDEELSSGHLCQEGNVSHCPGAEFGCNEEITSQNLDLHIKSCPMARIASAMKRQSLLLISLQEQLTMTKLRNDVLENGFHSLGELITTQIQPQLQHLINHRESEDEIEEIERDHLPNTSSRQDLLLPAHLRSITPSPDLFGSPNPQMQPPYTNQQIHALHSDLTSQIRHLTNSLDALSSSLSDIDARQSMHIMNETLRIREDMAQQGAALYSMRTQVQWLLNRDRIMAQQAVGVHGVAMRGRPGWHNQQHNSAHVNNTQQNHQSQSSTTYSNTVPETHQDQMDRATQPTSTSNLDDHLSPSSSTGPSPNLVPTDPNMSSRPSWMPQTNTASSSASTSPIFSSVRPPMRRHSGGSSQERVKL